MLLMLLVLQVPYKAQGIQISTELVEFLKHSTLDIPDNTPPVFQHIMKVGEAMMSDILSY